MLTIELAVDDRRGRYRWDGAERGDSCCVNEYCEMDGVEVAEAKLSIDFRGLALLISFEEAGAYEQVIHHERSECLQGVTGTLPRGPLWLPLSGILESPNTCTPYRSPAKGSKGRRCRAVEAPNNVKRSHLLHDSAPDRVRRPWPRPHFAPSA